MKCSIGNGVEYYSTEELLAAIIKGRGLGNVKALHISKKLLSQYSLPELGTVETSILQKYGLSESKAFRICALFEVARRYEYHTDEKPIQLSTPVAVYKYLYPKMKGLTKEIAYVLHLNTKNQLLREELISVGSLNTNIMNPREVFKTAILESASAVVLSHNHPSGDPSPSHIDIDITRRIIKAGELLDINVHDHIVIGSGNYVSLKEQSLI